MVNRFHQLQSMDELLIVQITCYDNMYLCVVFYKSRLIFRLKYYEIISINFDWHDYGKCHKLELIWMAQVQKETTSFVLQRKKTRERFTAGRKNWSSAFYFKKFGTTNDQFQRGGGCVGVNYQM